MSRQRRHRSGLASVTALLAVLMVGSVAMAGRPGISDQRSPLQDAPTPVPIGSIGITSWTYWVALGWVEIVGDVFNNTDVRKKPSIHADLFDASNVLLATVYPYPNGQDDLAAKTHMPFRFNEPAPAGFDHAVLTFAAIDQPGPMQGALLITPGTPSTDGAGLRFYPATITNVSSLFLRYWVGSIGLYDANGDVINVRADFLGPPPLDDGIAPGESVTHLFVLRDHHAGATRVLMRAQGFGLDNVDDVVASWNNYFDDIYNSQFWADIIWNAEQGITGGCDDGLFCPTANVTRGQMAAFLDRALHLPYTASDFFTDDETSIYEVDINRLAAAGITSGCTATTFCPTANVTRGQMAAFLDRALHLPATTSDFFTDDETSIYEVDINRLAAAGITGGCTASTFCPNGKVTRGQMAAFLHRALTN